MERFRIVRPVGATRGRHFVPGAVSLSQTSEVTMTERRLKPGGECKVPESTRFLHPGTCEQEDERFAAGPLLEATNTRRQNSSNGRGNARG